MGTFDVDSSDSWIVNRDKSGNEALPEFGVEDFVLDSDGVVSVSFSDEPNLNLFLNLSILDGVLGSDFRLWGSKCNAGGFTPN